MDEDENALSGVFGGGLEGNVCNELEADIFECWVTGLEEEGSGGFPADFEWMVADEEEDGE